MIAHTGNVDIGNMAGGTIGVGPEVSIYFGHVEEMSGKSVGGTFFVGGTSLTITKDASGNWGVTLAAGGKVEGFGIGFHEGTTGIRPYWESEYGKNGNCK